jgi:hypothetical protein
VIAIEPEQHNYDILTSALMRAGLSGRTRALKAAAVAVAGTARLEINPLHPRTTSYREMVPACRPMGLPSMGW